jgi:signal transduction histidine kinase
MASLAEISLERRGPLVTLTLSDNGGGLSSQSSKMGLGMLGMQERARAARGSFMVESRAEAGVVIRVSVPYTEANLPNGANL